MMYRLIISGLLSSNISVVKRTSDSADIPLDPGNRDYVQFLKDWKDGAEVLDADGNPLPYSDEALAALEVK
jgi:hypothetical protein